MPFGGLVTKGCRTDYGVCPGPFLPGWHLEGTWGPEIRIYVSLSTSGFQGLEYVLGWSSRSEGYVSPPLSGVFVWRSKKTVWRSVEERGGEKHPSCGGKSKICMRMGSRDPSPALWRQRCHPAHGVRRTGDTIVKVGVGSGRGRVTGFAASGSVVEVPGATLRLPPSSRVGSTAGTASFAWGRTFVDICGYGRTRLGRDSAFVNRRRVS